MPASGGEESEYSGQELSSVASVTGGNRNVLVSAGAMDRNSTLENLSEVSTSSFWYVVASLQQAFLLTVVVTGAFSGLGQAGAFFFFAQQPIFSIVSAVAEDGMAIPNIAQNRCVPATPTEPVSRLNTSKSSTICRFFVRMSQSYGKLFHFPPLLFHLVETVSVLGEFWEKRLINSVLAVFAHYAMKFLSNDIQKFSQSGVVGMWIMCISGVDNHDLSTKW